MRRRRACRSLLTPLLALTTAGAAVLGWSLLEAQAYTLRRFDVPILPPGAPPIRLLHISDLHLMPGDRRRIEWVRSLAEHRPDLVITTGDNLAHARAVPGVLEALDPLLEGPGAFVTGSNDFYAPVLKNPLKYLRKHRTRTPASGTPTLPSRALITALHERGWSYLDNARARLVVRGTEIDLVGTGDAHIGAAAYPSPVGLPAAVRIGITHAPYSHVLEQMRADGADLALAGHTHGGQVCLPGVGALVTNCDLDRRMAKGLHRWPAAEQAPAAASRMWLHVSAGLGTSPFTPIRLACRPEASLLTLTPAGAPNDARR